MTSKITSKIFSLKNYIAITALIFAGYLAYDALVSETYYFTPAGIRIAFMLVVLLEAIYLLYEALRRRLDMHKATIMVMVAGFALRICYVLFTDSGTRTHDVYRDAWGHIDYIKYIADNFALPPVNECQAYHPPVHHIICAAILVVTRFFGANFMLSLKCMQFAMLALNCLTLWYVYKILKITKCNGAVLLAGIVVFAFHPSNIYFASKINNDNTMLFFYTAAFYYLLKWLHHKSIKNIVLISVFASLAVLTKKSGLLLAPVIFAVFAKEFFQNIFSKDFFQNISSKEFFKNIKDRKYYIKFYIKQYCIFLLIFIPLSMSHTVRNYLMFGQKFGYVPSFGKGFEPTIYNLLYIPFENFLKNPFNNGGLFGGEYFIEFLFKSSLFGEWRYPGLENLGIILSIAAFAVTIVFLIYLFLLEKSDIFPYGYIFILNFLMPLAAEIKFRFDFPVACSQDFRYIIPVLVSVSYFLGHAVKRASMGRYVVIKYFVISSIAAFCFLSALFIMALATAVTC